MKNIFSIAAMQLTVYIFVVGFLPVSVCAQDSALPDTLTLSLNSDSSSYEIPARVSHDTIPPFDSGPNKKRIRLVAAANIIGYPASMFCLYTVWYSNYPRTHFHFFNDNNEWKQVDKAGHAYSAYIESYAGMEMWRWAGISRNKRIWYGGMSGAVYQTVIETLDGFSADWGWSWGDFAANMFGSGLFLSQEFAWDQQRVQFKFSFHPKNYGAPDLNKRADELFGKRWNERMIKDYNGQTYWLSANLKSFMPASNLPPWLSVAVGYGADGMFGAVNNLAADKLGNITFNRTDISRYRQYYLSPDIDLTKIKTKSRFLKILLGAANALKFPLPSLEYNSKGQFIFHLLHF